MKLRRPKLLSNGIIIEVVISEFQKGHLTIRESAKLIGLTYEDFVELLGEQKLSFINASQEELEQSYYNFERFLQTYQPSLRS